MRKLLYFSILTLSFNCFAGGTFDKFKSDDFVEYLKKQTDPIKDYNLRAYRAGGVKFEARYLSTKLPGYYLQVQDIRRGDKDSQKYAEDLGPYTSLDAAKAAQAAVPKDAKFRVVKIVSSEGEYTNPWYDLQNNYFSGRDKDLTDCYTSQLKEIEKIKSDDPLSIQFKYMDLGTIAVQMVDLRGGIPNAEPTRQMMGFQTFTISVLLDDKGVCKITTLEDLRKQLAPNLEKLKKLLGEQRADDYQVKRDTRFEISDEQHKQLIQRIKQMGPQPVEQKTPVKPGDAVKTGT